MPDSDAAAPPDSGEAAGRAVLTAAVEEARRIWGEKLLAAYALGSLAHGGFSPLVSDVDLGLVLAGPLAEEDAAAAASIGPSVAASPLPLADRLSIFWGSRETLAGNDSVGRFPPIDRMDLIQYGRLLSGRDVRAGLRPPTRAELGVQGAQSGLALLRREEYRRALAAPASLLGAGPKSLTKTVLFPVRFLYTLRTGEIGRNHDAVKHFVGAERGPTADLAGAALCWRDEPPAPTDSNAQTLLETGLRPIYELFVRDYAEAMAKDGSLQLAELLLDQLRIITP